MTLNPVCENVETAQGVPLTVTGVAQVKIMKNTDLLHTASEQFLGKKEHEIKSTVLQTLEGHLRYPDSRGGVQRQGPVRVACGRSGSSGRGKD